MSTKEDDVRNALERFEQKEFRSIRQTALATTQARSTSATDAPDVYLDPKSLFATPV